MSSLTPEEKRKIYEEEKARIAAQAKIKSEADAVASKNMLSGCLVLVALFAVLVIAMMSCVGGSADRPEHDPIAAFVMSEGFVKDRLKSPSSAKFQPYSASNVRDLGNGVYEVTGYVDAQNSFGAMIRNRYYCKLRYAGGDRWVAESVEVFTR